MALLSGHLTACDRRENGDLYDTESNDPPRQNPEQGK
jgi:hypothetical protein